MKKSILIFLVLVLANSVFAQVPHIEADYDYPAPLMEMPRPSERGISVYYQNGKAGVRYKDSNITEPIYDKAYFNRSNGIIVKKEKKYGFYNKHAELIIPLRYDSISAVDSYTLKIKSNNKYGLVNIEGDKLLNIRHNDILGVSKSGMYVVKNKKGIIEILGNKGKKIISNLSSVRLYKNGAVVGNGKKYALITKNHQSGFIYDSIPVNSYNKNYKLRRGYTRNYRDVISMGQGLHRIVVLKEGKVGMIDTLNQVIIPIEQDEIIYQRRRDYYLVKKGKMFGYYLKKCDKYGSPFYDQIYMDGTVFLKVNKKGKWGIIDDATGEMILPTIYESVYMTNGTFILKKDRKKGVSDFKGKIIIPIIYDKIDNLANFFSSEFKGFYKVTIGKQSGIITSNNKTVIPIKFEYIGEFEDNFFLAVDTNRNFGLFSKSGEVVQKLKYDFIERKRKDKATVFFTYKNDLIGVLDQQGKEIFSPQFKKASIVPDESHDIVRVERYENAYFLAMTDTNNNTGLFDLYTGKFIIPRKYEKIYQQT
ncbi:MAG: WG repeat-containing protein, partial [Flavobacteriales bacterium]